MTRVILLKYSRRALESPQRSLCNPKRKNNYGARHRSFAVIKLRMVYINKNAPSKLRR